MATQIVTSGVTVSSLIVSGGDQLQVQSGGTVRAVEIDAGGAVMVSAGGVVSATTIVGSGSETVSAGGSVVGVTLGDGAVEVVSSGGKVTGLTAGSGAMVQWVNGAIGSGVTISTGARLLVGKIVGSGLVFSIPPVSLTSSLVIGPISLKSGAQVMITDVTVQSGGTLNLPPGQAVLSGVTVQPGGKIAGTGVIEGAWTVGAAISGVTVGDIANRADLEIQSGGSAVNVTVVKGSLRIDAGATATGTVVSGGADDVFGVTSNVTVFGQDTIESVGSLIGGTVNSGGSVDVKSGGSVRSLNVNAGGTLTLSSGYKAQTVTVSSGASVTLTPTTSAGQTILVPANVAAVKGVIGGVTILPGAAVSLSLSNVVSGAVVSVGAAATIAGATLAKGGVIQGLGTVGGIVKVAGVVSGALLGAGSLGYNPIEIRSGGVAIGVTTQNAALQVDFGGSVVSATFLSSGFGSLQYVQNAGKVIGSVEMTSVTTQKGGLDSGALVVGGGVLIVQAGGLATNAVVASGGQVVVNALGFGSALTASAGGLVNIAGGVSIGDVVLSGGTEIVASLASGTTVSSGGVLSLTLTGSASGATVSGGGVLSVSLSVSSGQTIVAPQSQPSAPVTFGGVTVLSGGSVNLTIPAIANGGLLSLGAGAMVSGGDSLFGLLVSSGGKLLGPGAVNGAVTDYGLISGVLVNSAPSASPNAVAVKSGGLAIGLTLGANAVLAVDSGATASATTVSSGGREVVSGGAVATGDTVSSGGVFAVAAGGLVSGLTVRDGGVVDVLGVAVTSAVVSGGQLILTSGGVTVKTLGVTAGSSLGRLTLTADGAGGANVLFSDTPRLSGRGQIVLVAAATGLALDPSKAIASFSTTATSDTASGFTAAVAWGDGTTSPGVVSGAGGTFSVAAGHGYSGAGVEPLSITITRQADGATLTLSGNVTVLDGLLYIASNPDLIAAGFTTSTQALGHYISNGQYEGRSLTTFDAFEYLASNPDLLAAGITTVDGAAQHYIANGDFEGRQLTSFDAYEYIASNPDLIAAGIASIDGGAQHYVTYGYGERRQLAAFDAFAYLASNPDLIAAGINTIDGAAKHYIDFGFAEHRQLSSFNVAQYLAANPDLIAAGLFSQDAATLHYVNHGYAEHRVLTNAANGQVVLGTSGADILTGPSGVSTLIGAGGADTFVLAGASGMETIYNGVPGAAASGTLQLTGANLSDTNVWFERVTDAGVVSSTGNDLKVEILGTSQSATLENWFVNAQSQLSSIQLTSAGVSLGNAQVANLVAAMATFEAGYGASHAGATFDPTSAANAVITDGAVLAAVNSDWKP